MKHERMPAKSLLGVSLHDSHNAMQSTFVYMNCLPQSHQRTKKSVPKLQMAVKNMQGTQWDQMSALDFCPNTELQKIHL